MTHENTQPMSRLISPKAFVLIRILLFISGIFTLAFGVATVIRADLGVPSWDVLHIGLSKLTSFSIGRWVQIIGVSMVLMVCAIEKKKPALGSMINILLVGYFMNLILNLNLVPSFTSLTAKGLMLLSGIMLMGLGSGMYVASEIGAGPRDGVVLLISRKFSISIRNSRTLLEFMALTAGWLIGGPVSMGTFVSVPLIGPVMQVSLKFWSRLLKELKHKTAAIE
jgi:uncharacterized membrane protein YczE